MDLFFILSGFVLTWNYLDRMGPSWSARANLHFLWLRLSRVWPIYLVTMGLAAAWIIFTLHVGTVPSPNVDKLTAVSFVRQLLMVQLWFAPFFDDTSWDGPAWSISAEWLAYLLFGLLVLLVFRIARVSRARILFLLAFFAALPPTVLLLASGMLYPMELATANRGAVHRWSTGLCRGAATSSHRRRAASGRDRVADAGDGPGRRPVLLRLPSGVGDDRLRRPDGGAFHAHRCGTFGRGGDVARAAVDPGAGLRRPDLVQPLHDSRARAYSVELGGGAVHHHDAEVGGESRRRRVDPRGNRGSSSAFHFVEEPAQRWMRSMVDSRDVKPGAARQPRWRREVPGRRFGSDLSGLTYPGDHGRDQDDHEEAQQRCADDPMMKPACPARAHPADRRRRRSRAST